MTEEGEPVYLRLYDMSHGMARQFGSMLLGEHIEYLPHTGIVAYGLEYFYGGGPIQASGISWVEPGSVAAFGQLVSATCVGRTHVPQEAFIAWLQQAGVEQFRADRYDLFDNNCNHFTSAVCQFLCGNDIPHEIVSLPNRVLQTPLGPMIRQWSSAMQQSLMNEGHRVEAPAQAADSTTANTAASSQQSTNTKRPDDHFDLD